MANRTIELGGEQFLVIVDEHHAAVATSRVPRITDATRADELACYLEPAVSGDWVRKLPSHELHLLNVTYSALMRKAVAQKLADSYRSDETRN